MHLLRYTLKTHSQKNDSKVSWAGGEQPHPLWMKMRCLG